MPFCPKCGISVNEGALFCPNCGSSLGASPTTTVTSSPNPQGPLSWEGPPPNPVTPSFTSADSVAIGKMKMFALLGIAGIALALIVPFALGFGFTSMFAISQANPASEVGSLVAVSEIVAIVGFLMGFVSIILVRSSFKTLSSVDRGFSTPSTMVLALFAGLGIFVIAFIALLVFVFGLAGSITTTTGQTTTISSAALGGIVAAGLLVIVGAIAALIGIIGLILGLWRAGERYDETLLKVGGILFIIPYVDFVAPILVFIGALNAQKKVNAAIAGTNRTAAM